MSLPVETRALLVPALEELAAGTYIQYTAVRVKRFIDCLSYNSECLRLVIVAVRYSSAFD